MMRAAGEVLTVRAGRNELEEEASFEEEEPEGFSTRLVRRSSIRSRRERTSASYLRKFEIRWKVSGC